MPARVGLSHMALASVCTGLPTLSWPGLSRPSTSFFAKEQDGDARDKPGHDGAMERGRKRYAIALLRVPGAAQHAVMRCRTGTHDVVRKMDSASAAHRSALHRARDTRAAP